MKIDRRWVAGSLSVAAGVLAAAGGATATAEAQGERVCLPGQTCVAGPFNTRTSCIQTQNNYARYYKILTECTQGYDNKWRFTYTPK